MNSPLWLPSCFFELVTQQIINCDLSQAIIKMSLFCFHLFVRNPICESWPILDTLFQHWEQNKQTANSHSLQAHQASKASLFNMHRKRKYFSSSIIFIISPVNMAKPFMRQVTNMRYSSSIWRGNQLLNIFKIVCSKWAITWTYFPSRNIPVSHAIQDGNKNNEKFLEEQYFKMAEIAVCLAKQ